MDNSKEAKTKNSKLKIHLNENEFNSFFSVLNAFIEADTESSYGRFAAEMQDIIIKYGREYKHKDENHIEINLYPNEAQSLINLFIVFESVFHKPNENYYEKFHQYKIQNN